MELFFKTKTNKNGNAITTYKEIITELETRINNK